MDTPAVAGRHLTTSIAEFERRCLALIAEEQDKPLPDNALVGTLCDAVRLAREFVDVQSIPARPDHDPDLVIADALRRGGESADELDALRAENERLREALKRTEPCPDSEGCACDLPDDRCIVKSGRTAGWTCDPGSGGRCDGKHREWTDGGAHPGVHWTDEDRVARVVKP